MSRAAVGIQAGGWVKRDVPGGGRVCCDITTGTIRRGKGGREELPWDSSPELGLPRARWEA